MRSSFIVPVCVCGRRIRRVNATAEQPELLEREACRVARACCWTRDRARHTLERAMVDAHARRSTSSGGLQEHHRGNAVSYVRFPRAAR